MKYTFKYERTELNRMALQCVDIPELKIEQLEEHSTAKQVVQVAYDALNLFVPIALLIGQHIKLASDFIVVEKNCFIVTLSKINEKKLLGE